MTAMTNIPTDSPAAPTRPTSESLDTVLGQAFPVLDDGFVRVVDYMGNDAAIVQAARVSYGTGTKKVHQDRGLIRYLLRNAHTTPFEMCEIKFHVRVPMDTWRQWVRHRTANINEYSTRYSVAIDSAQQTAPAEWRLQSSGNRQGSEGYLDATTGQHFSEQEKELQERSRAIYEERIEAGIAREQARKDLPLSTYTEAFWKVDLHNLLHFLQLRMDDHAQSEIRDYARTIGNEIVARWCPTAWEAFLDYRVNALAFSDLETQVLGLLISGNREAAARTATELGLIRTRDDRLIVSREGQELESKLRRIGLDVPWH